MKYLKTIAVFTGVLVALLIGGISIAILGDYGWTLFMIVPFLIGFIPVYIIGRKEESDDYIMYKAYNGCLFPLQMSDVEEIYVKDPNVKIDGNKKERVVKSTVFFKEPEYETRFPVFLQSRLTGDNIVVHYAKDNYKRERFVASKKYQYAFKTGDWGFE